MSKAKKTPPSATFEEEFERLEGILSELEGGELSLEESLQRYEQGIGALRGCRELLIAAERRVEELTPAGLVPSALGGEDAADDDG